MVSALQLYKKIRVIIKVQTNPVLNLSMQFHNYGNLCLFTKA